VANPTGKKSDEVKISLPKELRNLEVWACVREEAGWSLVHLRGSASGLRLSEKGPVPEALDSLALNEKSGSIAAFSGKYEATLQPEDVDMFGRSGKRKLVLLKRSGNGLQVTRSADVWSSALVCAWSNSEPKLLAAGSTDQGTSWAPITTVRVYRESSLRDPINLVFKVSSGWAWANDSPSVLSDEGEEWRIVRCEARTGRKTTLYKKCPTRMMYFEKLGRLVLVEAGQVRLVQPSTRKERRFDALAATAGTTTSALGSVDGNALAMCSAVQPSGCVVHAVGADGRQIAGPSQLEGSVSLLGLLSSGLLVWQKLGDPWKSGDELRSRILFVTNDKKEPTVVWGFKGHVSGLTVTDSGKN